MRKNLLLYILLGFLVVMNGFFLFDHFGKSNRNGRKGAGRSNFIVKKLQFDAAQTQQFEELDARHREKMKAILDDLKKTRDALFDKLSDEDVNTSEIDSIAVLIADLEKTKELETFDFLRAIGDLCDQDQKTRFNSIVKDALHRQGASRHGPGQRPGDKRRPPPPRH